MLLYAISDRRKSPDGVVGWARTLLDAGVDMLQIREKDLPAGELFRLVRAVLGLSNPNGTRILVNSRPDVAFAVGTGGVHLPSNAVPPSVIRRVAPRDFKIGVSCHTLEEVRRAQGEGADFALYGPVFDPLSKRGATKPTGLEGLRQACQAVEMPVLALGGIDVEKAKLCRQSGAVGIAGISLFLESGAVVSQFISALRKL